MMVYVMRKLCVERLVETVQFDQLDHRPTLILNI